MSALALKKVLTKNAWRKTFIQKAVRKMLVKLTLKVHNRYHKEKNVLYKTVLTYFQTMQLTYFAELQNSVVTNAVYNVLSVIEITLL